MISDETEANKNVEKAPFGVSTIGNLPDLIQNGWNTTINLRNVDKWYFNQRNDRSFI
jgi:hypothetical protein